MNEIDIIKLRKKLSVTQEKLAEMLGVTLRTVQNYEAGGVVPKSKYAILHNIKKETLNSDFVIEDTVIDEQKTKNNSTSNVSYVPLLPVSAYGGSLNEFVVSVKDSEC